MSKLIYFDFRCEAGHKFTLLVRPNVQQTVCDCLEPAHRILSAATINCGGGTDPDFPTAYSKWEKSQRGKRADEKKWFDNHGEDRFYGGDTQQSDAVPDYGQSSTLVTPAKED